MDSKVLLQRKDDVARIELIGRIDAVNAPTLAEVLKNLTDDPPGKIVFDAKDLEYISSAGLRAIIFAKQRVGRNVRVSVVAPQPMVLEVIRMSGLDTLVTIEDNG